MLNISFLIKPLVYINVKLSSVSKHIHVADLCLTFCINENSNRSDTEFFRFKSAFIGKNVCMYLFSLYEIQLEVLCKIYVEFIDRYLVKMKPPFFTILFFQFRRLNIYNVSQMSVSQLLVGSIF